MFSVVCFNLYYLTGRSQRSEGFQQCPAQHQTAGRDHHRLPETKAGGHQSQSDTQRDTVRIHPSADKASVLHNHCFVFLAEDFHRLHHSGDAVPC